ncbi:MAG TPA: lactate utilization protein [Sphaerochaeta sp.]|nr:lactate utilization protein [Sphaerochaeta sp.]
MDKNKRKNREQQVERTIKALIKNNMEAVFIPSMAEILPTVRSLIVPGEKVAVGGSMSLAETGVLEFLRSGEYIFFDRYKKGLSPSEIDQVLLDSFSVDTYFASANAVTEHGELYCTDGNSNRVAAMLYGPKQVILIVSWDKIVPDLRTAIMRVKHIAAPTNAMRLGCDTHCATHGKCLNPTVSDDNLMALSAGACEHTICSNYVVFSNQKYPKRIKVLLVGESFGY